MCAWDFKGAIPQLKLPREVLWAMLNNYHIQYFLCCAHCKLSLQIAFTVSPICFFPWFSETFFLIYIAISIANYMI